MPTVSAARGCSPTDLMRSPIGVRKSTTWMRTMAANSSQIIRFRLPKTPRTPGRLRIPGMLTCGTMETFAGVPWSP
jgi:hypothetical protein